MASVLEPVTPTSVPGTSTVLTTRLHHPHSAVGDTCPHFAFINLRLYLEFRLSCPRNYHFFFRFVVNQFYLDMMWTTDISSNYSIVLYCTVHFQAFMKFIKEEIICNSGPWNHRFIKHFNFMSNWIYFPVSKPNWGPLWHPSNIIAPTFESFKRDPQLGSNYGKRRKHLTQSMSFFPTSLAKSHLEFIQQTNVLYEQTSVNRIVRQSIVEYNSL